MASPDLQHAIFEVLQRELAGVSSVALFKDRVLVQISTADFEHGLGAILKKIQSMIDLHIPKRNEHLSLVIRDVSHRYENVFKIWKSVF